MIGWFLLNTDTNTQNVYEFSWENTTNEAGETTAVDLRATVSGASTGTEDQKIVVGNNISITYDSASQITLKCY